MFTKILSIKLYFFIIIILHNNIDNLYIYAQLMRLIFVRNNKLEKIFVRDYD